ncbi:MAG: endonuclease/exonuclease/phosphatase family protein, partial [Synergistaceae bacterium]|nr:endonuclease/exonuclease/phosphatase family protein [Synergistaceae bacterium]
SILHTYVPQGKLITHPDYILKQEFLKRVKKIIEQKINDKFMWLGDLNVAPTELDVAHPETKLRSVCFAPEIRECFNAAMQGLTDLFRKFNPGREIYSFFDYRIKDALKNNTGWRVDNILASPKLAELAANSFIDQEPRTWEKPSDHTPLIAEFNF